MHRLDRMKTSYLSKHNRAALVGSSKSERHMKKITNYYCGWTVHFIRRAEKSTWYCRKIKPGLTIFFPLRSSTECLPAKRSQRRRAKRSTKWAAKRETETIISWCHVKTCYLKHAYNLIIILHISRSAPCSVPRQLASHQHKTLNQRNHMIGPIFLDPNCRYQPPESLREIVSTNRWEAFHNPTGLSPYNKTKTLCPSTVHKRF